MSNIEKYFKYLYNLERSSMKYDLSNIKQLLKSLGKPHQNTKFIHIAGTNGKGGTASFLASILMEHGLKAGLFTSPHILRFNERIRINGKTINNSFIKNFLDANETVIKRIRPSFFEVNSAIAFKYFADNKVDVAIIEAGLGGRLDSTNIINPELIIITQIEIDHTDYLGNKLEDIAKEKLGIVKPGINTIVSDNNKKLKKLFTSGIEKDHLYFLDERVKIRPLENSDNKNRFNLEIRNGVSHFELNITSPLPGSYQARNIAAALFAAEKYFEKNSIKLKPVRVKRAVQRVKENTGYRCRFELIRLNKTNYIFDISHNASAIRLALSNFSNSDSNIIIFAMMNDKDYKSAIIDILKTGNMVIFTQPDYKRAIPANTLYRFAAKTKHSGSTKIFLTNKVNDAIALAEKYTGKNGNVLFIGSFFLVSEAIKKLKIQKRFR
jgi:dihydrofolate synthase / folylpolyglutamate synthase